MCCVFNAWAAGCCAAGQALDLAVPPAGVWFYAASIACGHGTLLAALLLSLLVLPLYIPTLIFGTEMIRRGQEGGDTATPMLFLAGITAGVLAVIPFAAAAALRVNLR